MVFSLPIGDEIKSPVSAQDEALPLSKSVAPSEHLYVKLSVVDHSKLDVQKRTKRNVIGDEKCPEGQRLFMNECVTQEKYDEMMGEDKR
ncbi:hypothetical protein HF086_002758 [Spodoptera exigua]|uniref:Uncharacterized protein n=1 Tax=Spodoptera exigua TaxID=7107 RepID=A0A922MA66_SPOEX|nr:hypothetical protein HF086_002758 [Spodoptera exigua]